MTDPYKVLEEQWGTELGIGSILLNIPRCVTVSGYNSIHARGFFPDLVDAVVAVGDQNWWLLDLDGKEHFVEFSSADTEDTYFHKLKQAPEWGPDLPFPYAVRYQGFIGSGGWFLLSDRDGERMYLMVQDRISMLQLDLFFKLVWNCK